MKTLIFLLLSSIQVPQTPRQLTPAQMWYKFLHGAADYQTHIGKVETLTDMEIGLLKVAGFSETELTKPGMKSVAAVEALYKQLNEATRDVSARSNTFQKIRKTKVEQNTAAMSDSDLLVWAKNIRDHDKSFSTVDAAAKDTNSLARNLWKSAYCLLGDSGASCSPSDAQLFLFKQSIGQ